VGKYSFKAIILVTLITSCKPKVEEVQFTWSVYDSLPGPENASPHPGLAGPFTGVTGGVLLIAGGANFPGRKPWEGGKKEYSDRIYALDMKGNQHRWINTAGYRLKEALAYGSSVSAAGGIICMGGENERGKQREVFLLKWENDKGLVMNDSFPDLPVPLSNASATVINNRIYLAGGETDEDVSGRLFCLDLDKDSLSWETLPPVPVKLSHGVFVSSKAGGKNYLYLLGGRRKDRNGISELYNRAYRFDPDQKTWSSIHPLPYALSAGTGAALDKCIFLFGGDKGEVFHRTELLLSEISKENDPELKKQLVEKKNSLQQAHPGFDNNILMYDTDNDTWKITGSLPFPVPVTTSALSSGNAVIIPSGEIRAGVRTPLILEGIFKKKKE